MKKLCISVLMLLVAVSGTTMAQVPDCAVRVDRVAFCEDGVSTDFGYEKEDEMVTETCEAQCDAPVKFRFRINNGGTQPLTNCTLVDSNALVSGPLSVGDINPGQSVQNIFIDRTCSPDLDDAEPGTLVAMCECVDSEGFDQTVMAEDSVQLSCVGGTCDNVDPFCGDGNVDAGEECDDGNNIDGDGCDANCMFEPFCGDGNIDPGEDCDDGNNIDGDGCSAECTIEPFCGDGNLDDGEECDDGNNNGGDGCSADCKIEEPGDQGCTPGYWKNHCKSWEGYRPHDKLGSAFSALSHDYPHLAHLSLKDALHFRGGHGLEGAVRNLLRHATAALLNASNSDVMFGRTAAEVIDATNAAILSCDKDVIEGLKNEFDLENNAGCPLGGGKPGCKKDRCDRDRDDRDCGKKRDRCDRDRDDRDCKKRGRCDRDDDDDDDDDRKKRGKRGKGRKGGYR